MSLLSWNASSFMASFIGPMDWPSPMTSSVTPWRMSLCDRPSSISDSVAQLSMLMKPGATARPLASMVFAAAPVSSPIAAMRSPLMPISAWKGAPPSPA
jgi:hypothetical protein